MRVQRWHDAEGEPLSAVFEVHSTTGIRRKQWHNLAFLGAFETPPTLLAEVQGPALGSPLTVRWDVKDTNCVGVTLAARAGAEEKHDASIEVVAYIALQ